MKFAVSTDLLGGPELAALPARWRTTAIGVWTFAGAWSGASYDPGFVPTEIVQRWDPRLCHAARLLDARMWTPDVVRDEDGFHFPTSLCTFVAETVEDARALRETLERRRAAARKRRRRPIPLAVRVAVYERDGFACVECTAVDDLTLDHIWPWSLGGRDTEDNLRTLCRSCNSRKGARV